jgi:hypothetical protein
MKNEIPASSATAPAATAMASVPLKPPPEDAVVCPGRVATGVLAVGVGVEIAGRLGLRGFGVVAATAAAGAMTHAITATESNATTRRVI